MEPTNALPPGKRLPTLPEALIPLVAVGLLLAVGYGLLGIRIEILLIAAAAVAAGIGLRLGYTYQEMENGVNLAIYKSMTALLIITVVGALIAAWLTSGTIQMLIYYGLKIISPAYFLVTACIVCSVVSVVTGTSWGSAGTVGIALMGIAAGLGINPAAAAGAVIAGSYFGDKVSPFSDTTNLAPAATRANLYDHIGHMMWTTTPAYLIGLGVYFAVGRGTGTMEASPIMVELSEGLAANYHITGWVALPLLLPALITLGAALVKKPVIPSMLLSCLVAWILAVAIQGDPPIPPPNVEEGDTGLRARVQTATWPVIHPLYAMIAGYRSSTGVERVDSLLSRGGMLEMMDTMLIALAAFGFAGIITATRTLDVLLAALLTFATSVGKLVLSAALSCIAVALCTGSSYLSILLPGELFAKAYRDRGLAAKNLSRTTEDCGTVIVPLIPWSIAGVYMTGILGVPTVQYAPWAFMCYLGVVFAVLYGFTGFRIAPRINDDETKAGS